MEGQDYQTDLLPKFSIRNELALLQQEPNFKKVSDSEAYLIQKLLEEMEKYLRAGDFSPVPDELMGQWYYLLQKLPNSNLTTYLTAKKQREIYKMFLLKVQTYLNFAERFVHRKSELKVKSNAKEQQLEQAERFVIDLSRFLVKYSLINPEQVKGELYPIELQSLQTQTDYYRRWTEYVVNVLTQNQNFEAQGATSDFITWMMEWSALIWAKALFVKKEFYNSSAANFAGQWFYFLKSYENEPWSVIESKIPWLSQIKDKIVENSMTEYMNLQNQGFKAYNRAREEELSKPRLAEAKQPVKAKLATEERIVEQRMMATEGESRATTQVKSASTQVGLLGRLFGQLGGLLGK